MLTKQQEIIKLEIPQKIPIPRIIKKYIQTHSRQGKAQEFVIWTWVYSLGTSFMNSGYEILVTAQRPNSLFPFFAFGAWTFDLDLACQ